MKSDLNLPPEVTERPYPKLMQYKHNGTVWLCLSRTEGVRVYIPEGLEGKNRQLRISDNISVSDGNWVELPSGASVTITQE